MTTLVASAKMRARVVQVPARRHKDAASPRRALQAAPVLLDSRDKSTPNRDHLARQAAIYARLRVLSPALFASHPPRPMAIGVKRELIAALGLTDARDLAALRGVLRIATERRPYLMALTKPGADRYDLAGVAIGPVSPEHRVHAAAALARAWRPAKAA